MEPGLSQSIDYRRKRQRISRACNRCRALKVRCDDRQPVCSRCARAKVICITSDDQGCLVASETRQKTKGTRRGPANESENVNNTSAVGQHDAVQPYVMDLLGYRAPSLAAPSIDQHTPGTTISTNDVSSVQRGNSTATPKAHTLPSTSDAGDLRAFTTDMGMAVNTDDSTFRRQYLGPSSLQVMTQWLNLTLAAYGASQSFSSRFRHGMRGAVEFEVPMSTPLPILAPTEEIETLVNLYFDKNHVIFPVLEKHEFSVVTSYLSTFSSLQKLDPTHRPLLACVYAVLSIGADEQAAAITTRGTKYLQAAYSLYPQIVGMPYLSSVQALLLITVALMGRNKEGAGWHTLGHAIRMAHSLAMHRRQNDKDQSSAAQTNQLKQIWWVAYCLERLMAFETGRPGMIDDEEIDQSLPSTTYEGVETLAALVGLARIQGQISHRLYASSRTLRNPKAFFTEMASINGMLQSWLQKLPEEIRPGQDILWCSPELVPFASYLALQYHQVVITLHRPALLFHPYIYQQQLGAANLPETSFHRLRAGEAICASCARSTIALLNNARQQNRTTQLFTMTHPLLALYVLAIQIIKHPWSWSSATDLKLMETTSTHVADVYKASGQDPGFYSMLQDLRNLADQSVQHAASRPTSRVESPGVNPAGSEPKMWAAQAPQSKAVSASMLHSNNTGLERDDGGDGALSQAGPEMYDTWPLFFGDEVDINITAHEASNLFGLPFVGDDFDFSETMLSQ